MGEMSPDAETGPHSSKVADLIRTTNAEVDKLNANFENKWQTGSFVGPPSSLANSEPPDKGQGKVFGAGGTKTMPEPEAKGARTTEDPVAILNKQLEDMLREYQNWDKNASAVAAQFWTDQLQHTKAGSEEAKEIWRSLMDAQKQLYTEGQTQAQQAAKNTEAISKGAAAMQKSDGDTAIKIEEEKLNMLYSLGQISAGQRFSQLQALYNQQYAAEMKAYYDELAHLQQRGDATLAEQVHVWVEIEKAQNAHLEKMRKDEDQYLNTERKQWEQYAKSVGNAITGLVFHHNTLFQTMRQYEEKFFSYVIDTLLQRMVQQWLASETSKTTATIVGSQARAAAENAGTTEGMMAQAAAALKQIVSYAATTFAGVYSALAGIPYVGPIIAPAAAAGSMGAVLAVEGMVASAAYGYDIGSESPLIQAHPREMVLPEPLAEGFRNIIGGGGGGGGGRSSITNVNLSAVDGPSLASIFRRSNNEILRG